MFIICSCNGANLSKDLWKKSNELIKERESLAIGAFKNSLPEIKESMIFISIKRS